MKFSIFSKFPFSLVLQAFHRIFIEFYSFSIFLEFCLEFAKILTRKLFHHVKFCFIGACCQFFGNDPYTGKKTLNFRKIFANNNGNNAMTHRCCTLLHASRLFVVFLELASIWSLFWEFRWNCCRSLYYFTPRCIHNKWHDKLGNFTRVLQFFAMSVSVAR